MIRKPKDSRKWLSYTWLLEETAGGLWLKDEGPFPELVRWPVRNSDIKDEDSNPTHLKRVRKLIPHENSLNSMPKLTKKEKDNKVIF